MDVTSPIPNWDDLVKTVRDDLAHHNLDRTFDTQMFNWLLVEPSVLWVLRLYLLLHVGFNGAELREALVSYRRFEWYRARLRRDLADWDASEQS